MQCFLNPLSNRVSVSFAVDSTYTATTLGDSRGMAESMVSLARLAGAAGAKLTGAGGGGSIAALCPGNLDEVRDAFRQCGYHTLVPGTSPE